jgi:tetrahydromethanopterin S-methyltransferase subunit F
MKRLASFVMQGLSQSVMVTTVLAMFSLLFPLVGILSSASVGLVSLRQGLKSGAMTAGVSTLVTGALMMLIFGNPLPALVFLLLQWIPVGLLAWLLRGSRSLTLATHAGLGLGILAVAVQMLSVGNPTEFWRMQLQPMAQRFVEAGLFDQGQTAAAVAQLAPLMCGVVAAGYLLQLLFSLYVARWWQALLYNPSGFSAEFRQLRLHRILGLLGGVVLAFWLIPGVALPAWLNCLGLVLVSIFLLQGLAVAHGVFGAMPGSKRWLVATYVLLLLFLPQMATVLVTVGLLDVWIDLRGRFPRKE